MSPDQILRDILLGFRVAFIPQLRVNGGRLVRRHPGASAKRHVFLCVGRAWKTNGTFVATRQDIHLYCSQGGKKIFNNHHAQAVRQRSAGDCRGRGGRGSRLP